MDKMTANELCEFMRGWIHSLSEDRFSRVQSIIKLESDFREKVANKRKSNDGTPDQNGSPGTETRSPVRRSTESTQFIRSPIFASNLDSDLADWICIFCKNSSHSKGLGDLFGPYYLGSGSSVTDPNGQQSGISAPKPRAHPKKMKLAEYNNSGREIWFHDACITWASGVYLIGHHVKNVEEIISKSAQNVRNDG